MGDHSNFNRASLQWEHLHRMKRYSVEPADGTVAVLFSFATFEDDDIPAMDQVYHFEEEAFTIARGLQGLGRKARVFAGANDKNLAEVFGNQQYSSVYLIGHGTFSTLWQDPSQSRTIESYDWFDISRFATHLKLGVFTQRTCGHFAHDFNAPLGTFAMAQHSNIYSPVGEAFAPESTRLDRIDEEAKIRAVCDVGRLSYKAIKNTFIKPTADTNKDEELED